MDLIIYTSTHVKCWYVKSLKWAIDRYDTNLELYDRHANPIKIDIEFVTPRCAILSNQLPIISIVHLHQTPRYLLLIMLMLRCRQTMLHLSK